MKRVLVGYGDYSGYSLGAVPDKFLSELAVRFPLSAESYDANDGETLLITVAVHEEAARRANGGEPQRHVPTVREFRSEIIKNGFRQLSLTHHPDHRGDNESQRNLIEARDMLERLCGSVEDEFSPHCTIISAPRSRAATSGLNEGIGDDDVPF